MQRLPKGRAIALAATMTLAVVCSGGSSPSSVTANGTPSH